MSHHKISFVLGFILGFAVVVSAVGGVTYKARANPPVVTVSSAAQGSIVFFFHNQVEFCRYLSDNAMHDPNEWICE